MRNGRRSRSGRSSWGRQELHDKVAHPGLVRAHSGRFSARTPRARAARRRASRGPSSTSRETRGRPLPRPRSLSGPGSCGGRTSDSPAACRPGSPPTPADSLRSRRRYRRSHPRSGRAPAASDARYDVSAIKSRKAGSSGSPPGSRPAQCPRASGRRGSCRPPQPIRPRSRSSMSASSPSGSSRVSPSFREHHLAGRSAGTSSGTLRGPGRAPRRRTGAGRAPAPASRGSRCATAGCWP